MSDIVHEIGKVVELRPAGGRHYVGLCPFHKERTPSFHVAPERGIFVCFGCGATGNAEEFARRVSELKEKTP